MFLKKSFVVEANFEYLIQDLKLPLQQWMNFNEPTQKQLLQHAFKIQALLNRLKCSLQTFLGLSEDLREQLLCYSGPVCSLISYGLSFHALIALNPLVRQELLTNFAAFENLIFTLHLHPAKLLYLNSAIFKQLLEYKQEVIDLVKENEIPFTKLVDLDETTRHQLLYYSSNFKQLKTAKLPLDKFLTKDVKWRENILKNSFVIQQFVNNGIPLTEILGLSLKTFMHMCEYCGDVIELVKEANIPFYKLAALPEYMRTDLCVHSKNVKKLIKTLHFSFSKLTSLEPSVFKEIVSDLTTIHWLEKENLCASQLTKLSFLQFCILKKHLYSEEAQKIICPPPRSFCALF